MTDIFDECQKINMLIEECKEKTARNELIRLLDHLNRNNIAYDNLVNHMIRRLGLYPYIKENSATWEDRFIYEAFKVNVGDKCLTLHREQSRLLKLLLEGENLAISAPTSFGKSFVIDAFIAIKRPKNVMIIVPTIALTDETRRRIYKKFSSEYKIITTSDVDIAEKNIFIFPQERAISYINKLHEIDMLIIDEFYKASPQFDKKRSPALLKAILKLGEISKQKYYLSPNISSLKKSVFTQDMKFERFDFNTVFLEKHRLFTDIKSLEDKKNILIEILKNAQNKSLIYAGTYTEIDILTLLLTEQFDIISQNKLLQAFSKWLENNYTICWGLSNLVKRGIGIHNGSLHRSLSQIQIKLFEEPEGLKSIISTSSIIEGVNTSAENIIIWKNKNGSRNLNDFTYNNIIGRSGRMFKHFVGKVFILDKPPVPTDTSLTIEPSEEIWVDVDRNIIQQDLTKEQVARIIEKKEEMETLLQIEDYDKFIKETPFQTSNSQIIKNIVLDMMNYRNFWNGLNFLNSENPDNWERFLYKAISFLPGAWEAKSSTLVNFVKLLTNNWKMTIPELLEEMKDFNININDFFRLERNITFNMSSIFGDISLLYNKTFPSGNVDISSFIAKLSNAFLPAIVYQLEEYGLPRMIARKIDNEKIFDFTNNTKTLHETIEVLKDIGYDNIIKTVSSLDEFDKYILKYFYDGI